jgi:UDP-2,4-diacetamido-2,4,6-trideoxy-beta-L-altropyranose hydrolase
MCAPLEDHFLNKISSAGFPLAELSVNGKSAGSPREDAAACLRVLADGSPSNRRLIVDHYGLAAEWEALVRPAVSGLMVIDDLANRPHACDLLLDQTHGADDTRYCGLLPGECQTLLGARYALLRPEFARAHGRSPAGEARPRGLRMHVFFGTGDVRANVPRFARLLLESFADLELRVVAGVRPVATVALESLVSRYGHRLDWRPGVPDMAAHMSSCVIALGAPGMATWERACVGLPAAYIAVTDNQVPILGKLASDGFCVFLGRDTDLPDDAFVSGVARFLKDKTRLAAMRAAGLAAVDGHGADRVATVLLGQSRS